MKSVRVLILAVAGLFAVSNAIAQTEDFAVVVNPQNGVSNVSRVELRKILAGQQRTWKGNTPVKIIVRISGTPERTALLRLLGMTESDYKEYWTAQIVRGEADSEPLLVPSVGMVKEAVKIYPGAISLIAAKDLKIAADLKVLKVDGHAPGEPSYPLH